MNVGKLVKFMDIARAVSALSKDRSSKVGVIILGPDNEIRSVGYNGFTRGLDDENEERHQRPEKYFWSEHGERNAIYNAAKVGIPLQDCRLICAAPIFICMDCARAIVQCGIKTVVVENHPTGSSGLWEDHAIRTVQLFKESEIDLLYLCDEVKKEQSRENWII